MSLNVLNKGTNVLNKRTKKNKKDHAAGKIAKCPLSFLLLDPPPTDKLIGNPEARNALIMNNLIINVTIINEQQVRVVTYNLSIYILANHLLPLYL